MHKITVIGAAGRVGENVVKRLMDRKIGDVIVGIDIKDDVMKAKADELEDGRMTSGPKLIGTADYEEMKDSELVIIPAGVPRKEEMTRDDLLGINSKIIKDICDKIKLYAPNAIVIFITNPVTAMTYLGLKATGFPKNRIIAMASTLDFRRFQRELAKYLEVDYTSIVGFVFGDHGDSMVVPLEFMTVNGINITEYAKHNGKSMDVVKQIIERVKTEGGRFVSVLGGSAYHGPGECAAELAEMIIRDEKKIISTPVMLEGEYGFSDVVMGVPCVIGKNGIEKIIELSLSSETEAEMQKSAEHIRENIEAIKKFI